AAQCRSAMATSIIERANLAGIIANHNKRPQSKPCGYEIIGIRNLAFVREIDPSPAEDVCHLGVKDRLIGINKPVNSILLHQLIEIINRRVTERVCHLYAFE